MISIYTSDAEGEIKRVLDETPNDKNFISALLYYIDCLQRQRAAGGYAWLSINGNRMTECELQALASQLPGEARDTAEYLVDMVLMSSRDPLRIL